MGAEWQDFIDFCHRLAAHRRAKGQGSDALFIERVGALDKAVRKSQNPWKF